MTCLKIWNHQLRVTHGQTDPTKLTRSKIYHFSDFCHTMLCISAAYAILQFPSVTFVYSVETNKYIFNFFSKSSIYTILVCQHHMLWQYYDGDPLTGAKIAIFSNIWLWHWSLLVTDNVQHSSKKRFGLKINVKKTKTMTRGQKYADLRIKLAGTALERVTQFVYLGGLLTEDGKCTVNIKRWTGLASATFGKLSKMCKSKQITNRTKTRLYKSFVIPVLIYGCELLVSKEKRWTKTVQSKNKLVQKNTISNQ